MTLRVLVARDAWPADRFPQWAVDALRACGADVGLRTRSWVRWDAALVPGAASAPDLRRLRSRRVLGLVDLPVRPGDALLRGRAVELIAPSAALAASVRTLGAPAPRVVRPAVAARRSAPAAPDGTFRIAGVAPLHWSAGHEYAVVATASLISAGRRVSLRIVGAGPAREAVLFTAFDLGIPEALELVPDAPGAAEAALARADAFVLPAVEDRVWAGLLSAFAHGVPAVASDLPTVRELGGDRAALLVPPRDGGRMAEALDLLAADPGRRAELAAAGPTAAAEDLVTCGRALLGCA